MTQALGPVVTEFVLPLSGTATVPWRYMAAADHAVEWLSSGGAVIGTGAPGVAFTIAPEAAEAGVGVLSLIGSPPANSTRLRLRRRTAAVQTYDAPPSALGIEQQLDRQTLTMQELLHQLGGALRVEGAAALPWAPVIGSVPLWTGTGFASWPTMGGLPFGIYPTRAALVTGRAQGLIPQAGHVYWGGDLAYRGSPGATILPGLPDLVPEGQWDYRHFGAVGDGVADDFAAMQAAVTAAQAAGVSIRRSRTGAPYRLTANVIGNNTATEIVQPGATLSGGFGVFNVARQQEDTGGLRRFTRVGATEAGWQFTMGEFSEYRNSGGPGYGRRLNFFQDGLVTAGNFAIADGIVAGFEGIDSGGQGLAQWLVASTPLDQTHTYGCFVGEWDICNVGTDSGWARKRGDLPRWTGVLQGAAESKSLVYGGPQIGRHATFCFAAVPSGTPNDLGQITGFYNGLLIEERSIAPGGRGVMISGNPTAANLAAFGIQIDAHMQAGIDTSGATFSTGRALVMGAGQTVNWGTTGDFLSIVGTGGVLDFNVANARNFRVAKPAGTVVNWITARGSVTGTTTTLLAEGADANVGIAVEAKGTGAAALRSNGAFALRGVNGANAVNWIDANGSAAGASPGFAAVGSDTNLDLALTPKGTGRIRFGAFVGQADAPVIGHIEIRDAGGTLRKLAVVA